MLHLFSLRQPISFLIQGGGELHSPSVAWLTVTENDEPYGELEFAFTSKTLNIEESVGFTEIKVARRKGTYGRVTVDYHTVTNNANDLNGSIMKFAVFQSFRGLRARLSHSFSAFGQQYLLIGTHGMNGSGLYQWQGVFTPITVCQQFILPLRFVPGGGGGNYTTLFF